MTTLAVPAYLLRKYVHAQKKHTTAEQAITKTLEAVKAAGETVPDVLPQLNYSPLVAQHTSALFDACLTAYTRDTAAHVLAASAIPWSPHAADLTSEVERAIIARYIAARDAWQTHLLLELDEADWLEHNVGHPDYETRVQKYLAILDHSNERAFTTATLELAAAFAAGVQK